MERNDIERARDALRSIPPNLPRDEWHTVGRAMISVGMTIDDIDEWSSPASNYKGYKDVASAFRNITPEGGTGLGTLIAIARKYGYEPNGKLMQRPAQAPRKAVVPPHKPAPDISAADVWSRCEPATDAHPYIVKKQAAGVPLDNLRVVPAGDSLCIAHESMTGALVVPVMRPDGTLSSLQFITANKKLNLPGHSVDGRFFVGELVSGGVAYICEGIGTAWACWQATGAASVVCFGAGNMGKVAKALRMSDPNTHLVLVPDVGKEKQAADIAAEVKGKLVTMPEGWEQNADVNDLMQRDGSDVLKLLLEGATELPTAYPLSVVFADELSDNYEPPDELVQGVLTAGDGSVLYGDSNSGKTFVVIDLACAVARGTDWMGRKTEPGLVVYLAAESPSSVRGRLQAYQKHHGVKVPNFAIVQSPIDLFAGEADTDKVIKLVQMLEAKCGQAVRLIIGDTLARLSAGANENLGADMGVVVRHIDRIRVECKAHFLLIHHKGKNTDAGARGWSGVQAAVDTEISVTGTPAGRCLEITKQRDLPTKGERIGFRLDVVTLGQTKWGAPATSCVVNAADAPVKASKPIKLGGTQQAVMALLRGAGKNMRRVDIAKQLAEQGKAKTSVYNAVDRLRDVALVEVSMGMVHLIGGKS